MPRLRNGSVGTALALLAAALALITAPVTRAQLSGAVLGTQFPDPISTVRLRLLLAATVPLDDPRWEAIEAKHDEYLNAWRERIQPRGPLVIDRVGDVVTDLRDLDEARRFAGQIAELDAAFLAQIGEVLGPDAGPVLELAAQRRTIERSISTLRHVLGLPGDVGYLGAAALGAVRDPDRAARIAPLLDAHDRAAASLARRTLELGFAAAAAGIRAARDAKTPVPDEDHPERREGWSAATSLGAEAKRAELRALCAEWRRLEAQTLARLSAELPFDEVRAVRSRLSALREPWTNESANIEAGFRLALHVDTLTEADRTELLRQYREWATADARIEDEILALDLAQEGAFERRAALQAERRQLRDGAMRWLSRNSSATFGRWVHIGRVFSRGSLDPFDEETLFAFQPPPYAAAASLRDVQPVPWEQVATALRRVGVPEASLVPLQGLHEDYLRRWAVEIGGLSASLAELETTAAVQDPATGWLRLPAEAVPRLEAAFRRLHDAVIAADERLFDDIAAALKAEANPALADDLRLARLERTLDVLGIGDWAMSIRPSILCRPVNPVSLLADLPLGEDERSVAETALLDRATPLIEAAKSRAEASLRGDWRHRAASDQAFALQGEGDRPELTPEERVELTRRIVRTWRETDLAMAANWLDRAVADRATRALFGEAIAGLSDASRDAATLAYERLAVPEFFIDHRSAEPLLHRALSLPDLPAERRASIAALRDEYLAAIARFANRFADQRRRDSPVADLLPDSALPRDMAEAWILFERNERSARTIGRLRRMLSEEERAKLPRLAEYERVAAIGREVFLR